MSNGRRRCTFLAPASASFDPDVAVFAEGGTGFFSEAPKSLSRARCLGDGGTGASALTPVLAEKGTAAEAVTGLLALISPLELTDPDT